MLPAIPLRVIIRPDFVSIIRENRTLSCCVYLEVSDEPVEYDWRRSEPRTLSADLIARFLDAAI